MCNHPTRALIGTAEGIQCRICGAKFTTFEEIKANAEAPARARATANADAAEKTSVPPKRGRKKKTIETL